MKMHELQNNQDIIDSSKMPEMHFHVQKMMLIKYAHQIFEIQQLGSDKMLDLLGAS